MFEMILRLSFLYTPRQQSPAYISYGIMVSGSCRLLHHCTTYVYILFAIGFEGFTFSAFGIASSISLLVSRRVVSRIIIYHSGAIVIQNKQILLGRRLGICNERVWDC